ncbi:unnamed protein product [Eruca vesicaria subsp. sativa]|uniref:Peroxidase n=1 Tax=Eruca vesicaria subsp. sativa TaxID=29727 RepID=A0ABC8M4U8_ERUVS|nr:unnamed protein product [Eruca vesicaria subsp. sativa]
MASDKLIAFLVIVVALLLQGNNKTVVEAQLRTDFYSKTCPDLHAIVRARLGNAIAAEPRMAASVLRLFYLDCFVNGCDASILLKDTPRNAGEQNAAPNRNSVRGFEVIDDIRMWTNHKCLGVVSCADILAIAARDAVVATGGPSWDVPLGRRDTITVSQEAANSGIPAPNSSLSELVTSFGKLGFTPREMVALSGAHTIGFAQCKHFRERIHYWRDIDWLHFATTRKQTCPETPGPSDGNLVELDSRTPFKFDNGYFWSLFGKRGLLHSDQQLYNGGIGFPNSIVWEYMANEKTFRSDFAAAMLKMSQISPLTGHVGEIRHNCSEINEWFSK